MSFIFITGGCRSGKSASALRIAEHMLTSPPSPEQKRGLYMATAVVGDSEMRRRILRHQEDRGPLWDTFEWPAGKEAFCPCDAPMPIARYGVVLFDCLTLWASGLMEKSRTGEGGFPETLQAGIAAACDALLRSLRALPCPVVMVSNEVGMGVVPASYEGRLFRDLAGEANQAAAACADSVILTVSGLPLLLKGIMPNG